MIEFYRQIYTYYAEDSSRLGPGGIIPALPGLSLMDPKPTQPVEGLEAIAATTLGTLTAAYSA